jgi:hypothetical protein
MEGHWTDRLSDYLDGELDPAEQAAADRHLAECRACAEVVADLRSIAATARSLPDLPPSRDLWPDIRKYLLLATRLMSGFGFSDRTLTSENSLIPVAYYLKARKAEDGYLDSDTMFADREAIRRWLVASLLRSGYWTGAVDPILLAFRESIRECGASTFPIDDFAERVRKRSSKSTTFADEEIDELLEISYGDRSAFLALSLIFPGLDLSAGFHIDHLHPRANFYKKATDKRDIAGEAAAKQKERSEQLPNLQLLRGTANQEKSKKQLADWFDGLDATQRNARTHELLLDGLPLEIESFDECFEARRARMKASLKAMLAVASSEESDPG